MTCNTFYEDQFCTSCFDSEGTKTLNAPRTYRLGNRDLPFHDVHYGLSSSAIYCSTHKSYEQV